MFTALVKLVVGFVRALFPPLRPSPVARQTQRKTFSAAVLRADALLVLRLDFYNLRLQPGASGKEVVPDGTGDSFLIVHFPPQHVDEQAFADARKGGDPEDPLLAPPVAARLAGESRLVFHVNPALLPLDFSLDTILGALSQCADAE